MDYQVDGATFTRTVLLGTIAINGVPTKALQDDNGFTNYFTNDSNGIRLHRQLQPNVFIQDLGTVDLAVTFSPPFRSPMR